MGCGQSGETANKGSALCVIPNQVDAVAQEERKKEVAERADHYKWVKTGIFYPFVEGVPCEEKDLPGAVRTLEILEMLGSEIVENYFTRPAHLVADLVKEDGPFDEYFEVLPADLTFHGIVRDVPSVYKHWRLDEEFAQQKLNGNNPFMIRKYTEPMDKFPVTDELVSGLLSEGETLESMMKANKLYVCDYFFLDGCPVKEEFQGCWSAPIALFAVINGKLMPIAVQLVQDPSQGPIFTPKDDPGLWLLVKTFVNNADINTHGFYTHVASCHILMECLYVAAKRTLSSRHPLFDLLTEHCWYTIIINNQARTRLIIPPPEGFATSVYSCGYDGCHFIAKAQMDSFDFSTHNPNVDLAQRGVGNIDELPGYYYRDDAVKMWSIIEKYVTGIIDTIYGTEEDLAGDYELQAWAHELMSTHPFKNSPIDKKSDEHGGAFYFASKAKVIEFLTILINTGSVRHAAVNSGQFDYFGFIPSHPPSLALKLPSEKDAKYTDVEIAKGLPSWSLTVKGVALVATLSTPTDACRRLGQYNAPFTKNQPAMEPILEAFQNDLSDFSKEVKKRNGVLERPYTVLDPEFIPSGIDL